MSPTVTIHEAAPGEHRLEGFAAPPAELIAEVRSAQGRPFEAAEALQAALHDETSPRRREDLIVRLIEVFEEMGDAPRLSALLGTITFEQPHALARAGLAWLSLGDLTAAASRMLELADDPEHAPAVLPVLLVAAALTHRPNLAEEALRRLLGRDGRRGDPERRAMAEAWQRGLLGRLVLDQRSAIQAGRDPAGSVLQRIVSQALAVFESVADENGEAEHPARHAERTRHAEACRALLAAGGRERSDTSGNVIHATQNSS